jgi:deazaflavin-dependent oxidoreductase (nitroreductase family)
MSDWNSGIIREFRANEGKVGGPFEGAPLLLLHTTGAKSGKERVNPLMYRKDGDRFVIFGSKGGAPTNPDWYRNLLANPIVKIEVGIAILEAKARVAEPEERERIWTLQKKEYRAFADYEKKTDREIPVVILEAVTSKVLA